MSHGYFLQLQGEDRATVDAVMEGDLERAQLDDKDRALLAIARQVTEAAYKIQDAEIDAARQAGWEDADIAEAVLVAAMFAMFNRVADAFGLPDPGYFDGDTAIQPATQFQSETDSE